MTWYTSRTGVQVFRYLGLAVEPGSFVIPTYPYKGGFLGREWPPAGLSWEWLVNCPKFERHGIKGAICYVEY